MGQNVGYARQLHHFFLLKHIFFHRYAITHSKGTWNNAKSSPECRTESAETERYDAAGIGNGRRIRGIRGEGVGLERGRDLPAALKSSAVSIPAAAIAWPT